LLIESKKLVQKMKNKKRLLWIFPFPLVSSLPKRDFIEILAGLRKKGYDVSLLAIRSKVVFHKDESVPIHLLSLPLGDVPLLTSIMFAITLLFALPYYIIRDRPNFIAVRPDISVLSLIPILFFSKVRFVKLFLDVRSTPVETQGLRGYLQKFWFLPSVFLAMSQFSGITVISSMMKTELCNAYKISSNFVGVWPSGVSTALFDPKRWASKAVNMRQELSLSKKFIIFYHGIFTANRGLIETIHAMMRLKNSHPSLVLFLLGTGPITPLLKELINSNGLQDNVIVHGPVDHKEVPIYISMSDVCIIPLPDHPYWRNQSPLKLLEYLSMEKVVIATDIPAHRLVLGEKKCAVYIKSIDPVEIAKSFETMFEKAELLNEWGRTGRQAVIDQYDWSKVTEKLDVFLSILSFN
jgi:glycosyltransferase involved in cell wall biosynthesis